MLLQAFGQHGLHSQKLYTFTLGKLYQQTQAFERFNNLEFSILLSCLSTSPGSSQSPQINSAIRDRIQKLLSIDVEREIAKQGLNYFRHPFERIYSALINMEGDLKEEKDRVAEILSLQFDKVDRDNQTFLIWCLTMDDRCDKAFKLYQQHLQGKAKEILDEFKDKRINPIRTFYHALYVLKVLYGDSLTAEQTTQIEQDLKDLAPLGMPTSKDTVFSQNHEAILSQVKAMLGSTVPVE